MNEQKWQLEYCSEKPAEFERLNDNYYIQRRNIKALVRDEDDDDDMPKPAYMCECRYIPVAVYVELTNEQLRGDIDYIMIMEDL